MFFLSRTQFYSIKGSDGQQKRNVKAHFHDLMKGNFKKKERL